MRIKNFWPADLNLVERRAEISLTELWWVKEQQLSGALRPVDVPEKAFGQNRCFYTMFGPKAFEASEGDIYVIITEGNPIDDQAWCFIKAVNKISAEQASQLLSGWPYE